MSDAKLVVGLGTPAPHDPENRHSIGFRCIAKFAQSHDYEWQSDPVHNALIAVKEDSELILAKSLLPMNQSGETVSDLLRHNDIQLQNILVIHDDLDLPLGKIRLKLGGSDAGHRGIASIIEHLQTDEFGRLKVGISRPPKGTNILQYVLSRFDLQEEATVSLITARAMAAIATWRAEGISVAMNRYNQ